MGNNISLSGDKGCGKSQVALQLSEVDVVRTTLSFAQPLKKFLTDILERSITPIWNIRNALYGDKDNTFVSLTGVSLEDVDVAMKRLIKYDNTLHYSSLFYQWIQEFNNGEFKDQPTTGRRLLQAVGTEFFREKVRSTFWVDLMAENIEQCWNGALSVTVDDTRFPDEFSLLKSLGFKMVKILPPAPLEVVDATQLHTSEQSAKDLDFDMYFLNDKSLGLEPVYNFVRGLVLI